MAFKDAPRCQAKSKHTGEQCKNPSVTGMRVCRIHGGKTPKGTDSPHFKHGRYVKTLPKQILDKLTKDDDNDDPLDLLPELDVQRALFADFLSRFQDGSVMTASDIQTLMSWADHIGRMVERIVRQRNETALTKAELTFLAARAADVVNKYIIDPQQRQAFVNDLFAGTATPDGHTLMDSGE